METIEIIKMLEELETKWKNNSKKIKQKTNNPFLDIEKRIELKKECSGILQCTLDISELINKLYDNLKTE